MGMGDKRSCSHALANYVLCYVGFLERGARCGVDHVAAVGGGGGRDLQARQLADGCAREAVHAA